MYFGSSFRSVTIDFLRLEHGVLVFEIPYWYQCPSIYIPKHYTEAFYCFHTVPQYSRGVYPLIFVCIFAGVHLVRA